MSYGNRHTPPDMYPDDFSDLEKDGWYVGVSLAGESSSDRPQILLLPPGVSSTVAKSGNLEDLLHSPHLLMAEEDDDRPGVTVSGGIQTISGQNKQRHEAFTGDRRAHILAQRALWVLGASRMRFAWHSDGAGMLGSDNYAQYHTYERAVGREDAARRTWTYQKIAKPYGLTEVAGVNVELPPVVWDTRSTEDPVQRRIVTGYFEPSGVENSASHSRSSW